MQRKNHTQIQIETRFTRDYCFWWKDLNRKCSKSSVFIYSINWKGIQYIFLFRGAIFLTLALELFETIQMIL